MAPAGLRCDRNSARKHAGYDRLRYPSPKNLSAKHAAAASNACEFTAANRRPVRHAARQQRHDEEFWPRHFNSAHVAVR
jgi:hypothetical protein